MKRGTVIMLALAMGLAGIAGVAQAQQKFTAKIADNLAPDHPHPLTMKFFADRVKERTKGRMDIQVFPAAQLGDTKDLFMGVPGPCSATPPGPRSAIGSRPEAAQPPTRLPTRSLVLLRTGSKSDRSRNADWLGLDLYRAS